MFEPIVKENPLYPRKYYEKIIISISDMIASGELKTGDVLPSERELAEMYQLSRVPVREALKILEFLGVIEYIPGRGMIVKKIEVSTLLSKVFFGINTSNETVQQLFALRLLIEPYAAGQAAEHATQEDLAAIHNALTESDDVSASSRSLDFHTTIINASHNELLSELYKFLYSLLELTRAQSNLNTRYNQDPLRFHSEIYALICAHQPDEASRLMRIHLQAEQTYLTALIEKKALSEKAAKAAAEEGPIAAPAQT